MEVRFGNVGVLKDEMFDFVLANITRNTLVSDMEQYTNYRSYLTHLNTLEDSNWISLSFVKR